MINASKNMKRFMTIALLAIGAMVLSLAPETYASSFSYFGGYTLDDADNDGFRELLTFSNMIGPNSGAIIVTDPAGDAILMGSILVAPLTLDPTSPFDFDPTSYAGGFQIYSPGSMLLLTADLEVASLQVSGASGSINSGFGLNLTNIIREGASVPGNSKVIDDLVNSVVGGAATFTLQAAGSLASQISGVTPGTSIDGTYSGAASPVPEPSTYMMLGMGLVGLIGYKKRVEKKKALTA